MNNFFILDSLDPNPGAGTKNLNAVRNAVSSAISENCCGVLLPEGTYEIYNEKAYELYNNIITGKVSPTDYPTITSEAFKNTAFLLKGLKNFTFSGNRTVLKFNGLIAPFEITGCENLSLKDITIDWIDVPYFTADVVSKSGNEIEISPHNKKILKGGEPIVSIQNINMVTGAQGGMSLFEGISNLKYEDGRYTFTCLEPEQVTVGESLVLRYIYNYAPAIHIYRSKDVLIEDVTLRAAPGMGIIGQKVNNIDIVRLSVKPVDGRVMSTNTDATHFINCSGTINFDSCYFEGMGDDATNVHGFYHIVRKIDKNRIYTEQTQGSQDSIDVVFDKGHKIELVNIKTLQPYHTAEVLESGFDENLKLYYIDVSDADAAFAKVGDCVASGTEIAALNFKNCTAKNLRGRGVLVQTRNVKITGNLFEGCTGEGIHICTETGWWESIATRNIEINKNRFINCGFGSTKYCDAVAVVTSTNAPEQTVGVHRNIKITENEIAGSNRPFLITCADGVEISGNKIKCGKETLVSDSENVDIHDNEYSVF